MKLIVKRIEAALVFLVGVSSAERRRNLLIICPASYESLAQTEP